jgi:pyruvate,water dikinase
MNQNLLSLSEYKESAQARIGGKASHLAKLLSAGFPVPQGFVVPVAVYENFISLNGLKDKFTKCIEITDFDDEESILRCSKAIKDLVQSGKMDRDFVEEIDLKLHEAEDGYLWAVRSSAEAEDLPEASFAGQQDTFLGIKGVDILEHIKRCWASYWNERAMAYRQNSGSPQIQGGIAVLIQHMVDASSAGVMFTTNPITKKKNETIIESSWGLGESIVSGMVSPDRFTCDKATFKIIDEKINKKFKGIFLTKDGSKPQDIDLEKQNASSLTNEEIRLLMTLGNKIETYFGEPQDIEWAITEGSIFILQSRPITTLVADKEVLWTRAYGDEYWADITSPLFFSLLGEYLTKYVLQEGYQVMGYWELADLELLKLYKGHIYFNAAVLEAVFTYNPRFSRTKELLNYFPLKDQDRIANAKTKLMKRLWSEVRIAFKDPDGMIFRTDKVYKKWAEGFLEKMKPFDKLDLTTLSYDDLYREYHDMEAAFLKHYRLIRYGMVTHSIGTNLIIKTWLDNWLDDKSGELYSHLLSGLPDNKTITTNNALVLLARSARKDPSCFNLLLTKTSNEFLEELNKREDLYDFKSKFNGFLNDYGHRSHTRELFFPRWADDPTLVIDILKSLVNARDIDVEALEKDKLEKRLKTQDEIYYRISKLRFGFFKKILFRIVLGYAQTYLQFRENQRFYLDHTLLRQRRLFMEYGRRFAEQDLLTRQNDIFFLSKEEVFQMAKNELPEMKKEIALRRKEYEKYSDMLPPKFIKGKIEFDDTLIMTENVMKVTGTSASPGIVTGQVRIVDSIKNLSTIEESEILVTSNTDPGWTPVFSKLGGLITETGGILSHGAVVSREYGIPAVTAVKGARQIFKTGQRVTVDGNQGIIYIMEP